MWNNFKSAKKIGTLVDLELNNIEIRGWSETVTDRREKLTSWYEETRESERKVRDREY